MLRIWCFKVFDDPKRISIGSMDFDYPKVNGDKFILDGLFYVARLGSASLKIVQITRRGTRKLLKSLYYTTLCNYLLQVMQSAWMKVLALLLFSSFSINLTWIKHFKSNVLFLFCVCFSFFRYFCFFMGIEILNSRI